MIKLNLFQEYKNSTLGNVLRPSWTWRHENTELFLYQKLQIKNPKCNMNIYQSLISTILNAKILTEFLLYLGTKHKCQFYPFVLKMYKVLLRQENETVVRSDEPKLS